jgi:acyl-CoA synthetase (AMP-forming)/AMP-acid ligase II
MNQKYITDFVFENAAKYKDKKVIVCDGKELTAEQLANLVAATAQKIQKNIPASNKQQIVGMLLPNSWEFVVVYLAILHTGNIAMPLDTKYKKQQIHSIIKQLKPKLLITDEDYADLLPKDATMVTCGDVISEEVVDEKQDHLRIDPKKQIASLLFTSGTTGQPKAVPYTHESYIWNIKTVSPLWNWSEKDIVLLALPLSHWHGLAMVFTGGLILGSEVRIQDGFDADRIIDQLISGEITIFSHVPAGYAKLALHKPENNYLTKNKKPLCLSASSPLPPRVWRDFKARFDIEITERYGTSEGGVIAANTPGDHQHGTVGSIIPGVKIKFGEDGAIAVKSPSVFPGYYNHDTNMGDGWWFTGDIGYIGDDNRLYIKGRVQEKMKKNGYTVYPRDIEHSLTQLDAIKEAYVIGSQDNNKTSDTITYFIVGDIDEATVMAYAKQNMHTSWRPDKIIMLDSIPKNGNGKTDIKTLRVLAES